MENFQLEFHIARHVREKYKFDLSLFSTDGSIIIGNFHGARLLTEKINTQRDILTFPEIAVKASEIYAIGLMDEIFHFIMKTYREKIDPEIFIEAVNFIDNHLSKQEREQTIKIFLQEFPPISVYQQKQSIAVFLSQLNDEQAYALLLEELILLWVENQNTALDNYRELFSDRAISQISQYPKMMSLLNQFFNTKPFFGPENKNLIDLLRTPAKQVPYSIPGQLEYIRTHWSALLGDLYYKLLSGLDFIKEEQKAGLVGTGPGPSVVPGYDQIWDLEYEKFSPDREWMPSVVIVAKNAHVWLDQIRKKYNYEIYTLDQIPDEELDNLRKRGFTGLWLIGLWERSAASAKIKQLCGNSDAIASAYSLADYQIADELGGEEAFQNLKNKAWQKGIRLAADMVPNHMGIDSNWLYEHPDWFIQLGYSPYPVYSFNGPNLSKYPQYEIKIEDHYYERSDAAVVFLYHNYSNGETRFIYHGNDGTSMPWNDTAQLNYLLPEVREAVYQTILSVAKRFPIIRFDAAMTLAKKHYQRLWFPEPGSGGAIPSRAEFGLTKERFDQLMPTEFWREVVDRLAVDAPDTLLLAEAFWLMESYFVRTLGMHRVYNSAFMNMLRNEDNVNYRLLIKNTIEFDPQILKRFVNFMNNPDERTAVEQFGKGDKYFGICTLMSTLPGLPMFGHGQFEGFSEKYGMEYKQAYWDEEEDQYLISRHLSQISPLLHRRWLFSEVDHFLIYDFFTSDNTINEDVFAYTNISQNQAALIVYHNKFAETKGWIHQSASKINKRSNEDSYQTTVQLAEGLLLSRGYDFVIFKDIVTNVEYIRSITAIYEHGLFFELHAYQTHVFLDFYQINDDQWGSYRQLNDYLNGNGVPSIENAIKELILQPVQTPLKEILNRGYSDYLYSQRIDSLREIISPNIISEAQQKIDGLLKGIHQFTGIDKPNSQITDQFTRYLNFILTTLLLDQKFVSIKNKDLHLFIRDFQKEITESHSDWIILLSYCFISPLRFLIPAEEAPFQIQSWFDEWQFAKIIRSFSAEYQITEVDQQIISQTVHLLLGVSTWHVNISEISLSKWLKTILQHQEIQLFLKVNRYQDILWFDKERFENLIKWLFRIALLEISSDDNLTTHETVENILKINAIYKKLLIKLKNSGYQFEKLLSDE